MSQVHEGVRVPQEVAGNPAVVAQLLLQPEPWAEHGPCHGEWPPLVPWRGESPQQPWMGTHRPKARQLASTPEQLQNGADACVGACLQLLPNLITFTGTKSPITN